MNLDRAIREKLYPRFVGGTIGLPQANDMSTNSKKIQTHIMFFTKAI